MTTHWLTPIASLIGLTILLLRFRQLLPFFRSPLESSRLVLSEKKSTVVSIIIPARNEEANLPRLFQSIAKLEWSKLEVIIVDDESTDRTSALAMEFGIQNPQLRFQLVKGQARPDGWAGKNWACHQGYKHATGEWLLFTDADTSHEPRSLLQAVGKMENENLDLLSAVPFHITETFWEKLLGPFHIFLFVATAAFSRPKMGRLFAIGQYLLFKRSSYERQGGHERIKGVLCDDLELADLCLKSEGKYRVEGQLSLYKVRMYSSFRDFIQGWRRIIRLGFKHARITSSIEIYFVISALTAGMLFHSADVFSILIMYASLLLFALLQKRFGEFSLFGVLFLPFSLSLFVVVSLLAVVDLLLSRKFTWRGRSYQGASS